MLLFAEQCPDIVIEKALKCPFFHTVLLGGYNFLLLDEPTNHLDAFSREELENTLLNYSGTMSPFISSTASNTFTYCLTI